MPDRQRTLRAAIEWSFSMLDDRERELLARLAVFEGGWTLEAAEAVCGDNDVDVLDALSALVEQSLVVPWSTADAEPRFRMYEMIRAFAGELFESIAARRSVERRHVEHFGALARRGEALLRGLDHATWMARLEPEWPNLAAAWRRALAVDELETAVDIASCMWVVLWLRGRLGEFVPLIRETEVREDGMSPHVRAQLTFVAGAVSYTVGDFDHASELFRHFDDASNQIDDPVLVGAMLLYRAFLAARSLDEPLVERYLSECESRLREIDDSWVLGYCLSVRGSSAHLHGDPELACRYQREALELARRSGNDALAMQTLIFQALATIDLGDLGSACELLADAADLLERFPYYEAAAYGFEVAAAVAVPSGDIEHAALALGAADRVREVAMSMVWDLVPAMRETVEAAVVAQLGEAEFERVREEGRRMPPHAATRVLRTIIAADLSETPTA
jgi:ATP/maltotriose-dependent transcriptional regulator MalT